MVHFAAAVVSVSASSLCSTVDMSMNSAIMSFVRDLRRDSVHRLRQGLFQAFYAVRYRVLVLVLVVFTQSRWAARGSLGQPRGSLGQPLRRLRAPSTPLCTP